MVKIDFEKDFKVDNFFNLFILLSNLEKVFKK